MGAALRGGNRVAGGGAGRHLPATVRHAAGQGEKGAGGSVHLLTLCKDAAEAVQIVNAWETKKRLKLALWVVRADYLLIVAYLAVLSYLWLRAADDWCVGSCPGWQVAMSALAAPMIVLLLVAAIVDVLENLAITGCIPRAPENLKLTADSVPQAARSLAIGKFYILLVVMAYIISGFFAR